ncbi:MAG TPA: hypothetical protein VKA48_05430 [Gammaproteobacteria bacterium]|nr:hypothetical protein [Gammaproteobacteria bacterium]
MTYEEIQDRLQLVRGTLVGSQSAMLLAAGRKIYAENALDRAAEAAARGDRQATSDWLRTARVLTADRGNDPAVLDPAFQVLSEALDAHKHTEEQAP